MNAELTENEKAVLTAIIQSSYYFFANVDVHSDKIDIDENIIYEIADKLGLNI